MTVSAIAYLRTSSATNVEGDSPYRQNDAIMRFAEVAGLEIEACYWDAAVSGTDRIEVRPGFLSMLSGMNTSKARVIVVENPSRFARDYLIQGNGLALLAARGIQVIDASTGHDMTDTSDPMRKAMVAMIGVLMGLEKDMTVAKLRHGRDRASANIGKRVEGRKGYDDTNPELVKEAKRLARKNPKTGKVRSLREIATELAGLGFLTAAGKPFSASQVQRFLMY